MAAYASPPRSTGAASPQSTKSVLDSTFQALSQAPPPTIREILGAYSAKGEGDREMLVALLNAKSAEDQRIAAVATLQQTVLQMQHSLALAQAQAAASQPPQQLPSPRSGPSPLLAPTSVPAPRKRVARAPVAPRPYSRSPSPRSEHYASAYRAHPYAHARPHEPTYAERPREDEWASRRNWASMSSERSTSEEGSERE
ncbi:hypothetical protein BN14_00101 [Rhizoctonia solani AG-1 IB]|uniref:Uncharacterized protein n=1 Tax=Thanatephorus cucumeris (strain AG1-IB / isolate 7/3/14) TaxID=1108050 RepID=M5BI79_THACB|nr:hypothetical protein BN14_00101 [Rhizoctonia solani AG-1 IB]